MTFETPEKNITITFSQDEAKLLRRIMTLDQTVPTALNFGWGPGDIKVRNFMGELRASLDKALGLEL